MPKLNFLEKHGIVRNAIRKDLVYFAIPGIVVFSAGMIVSTFMGRGGLVMILIGLFLQPRQNPLFSVQNISGICLFIAGFVILIIAQITIGRYYSSMLIIRENHQLITHGIYGLIRHPIYFGVILVAISFPISSTSLLGFLIMSLLIPIFLIRIKFEEILLVDEFSDAYRAYQERTRKLIPFIY